MEGMSLTTVPPEAWGSSDLVKLNLSKNAIVQLPPDLTLCSSLQVTPFLYLILKLPLNWVIP